MRKTIVIAVRDYLASVRTKSFLVSLILMPVLMASGAVISRLSENLGDNAVKRVAVIDRSSAPDSTATGKPLWQVLREAAEDRNQDIRDEETGEYTKPPYEIEPVELPDDPTTQQIDELRYQLSERVRDGELFAFIEVGPGVITAGRNNPAEMMKLLDALKQAASELELDEDKINEAIQALSAGTPEQQAQGAVKLQSLFQEAEIEPHELAR